MTELGTLQYVMVIDKLPPCLKDEGGMLHVQCPFCTCWAGMETVEGEMRCNSCKAEWHYEVIDQGRVSLQKLHHD